MHAHKHLKLKKLKDEEIQIIEELLKNNHLDYIKVYSCVL